jgi:hypothetical protein
MIQALSNSLARRWPGHPGDWSTLSGHRALQPVLQEARPGWPWAAGPGAAVGADARRGRPSGRPSLVASLVTMTSASRPRPFAVLAARQDPADEIDRLPDGGGCSGREAGGKISFSNRSGAGRRSSEQPLADAGLSAGPGASRSRAGRATVERRMTCRSFATRSSRQGGRSLLLGRGQVPSSLTFPIERGQLRSSGSEK